MPFLRSRLPLAGLALALLYGAGANAQQTGFNNVIDAEAESVSRYAIEVILFTYSSSVTAGTEIFLPEEPVVVDDEPLEGSGFSGDRFPPGDGMAPFPGAEDRAGYGVTNPGTGTTPGVDIVEGPAATMDSSDGDSAIAPGEEPAGDVDESIPNYGDTMLPDDAFADIDLDQPLEQIVIGAASVEYTPLVDEALTLADAHERLLRLDAYDPVLWAGWTQIVREQSVSPAINLRRLGNLPLNIEGELTLYLGRFVHLDVDIRLEEPVNLEPDADAGLVYGDRDGRYRGAFERRYERPRTSKIVYRIDDDRIMRNGETRYFDHPKFGLIARLTLVEEEENADDVDPRFLPDLLPGNVDSPP